MLTSENFPLESSEMVASKCNIIGQVAYTKARLKSVLPTEKKKKKESQVYEMQRREGKTPSWIFMLSGV